jgi:hypothetical protein
LKYLLTLGNLILDGFHEIQRDVSTISAHLANHPNVSGEVLERTLFDMESITVGEANAILSFRDEVISRSGSVARLLSRM